MEHAKARWIVTGAGLEGRTYPVFVAAVSALACELSAEADQYRDNGGEAWALMVEEHDIPEVLGWERELARDRFLLAGGKVREVRLETSEETEGRLMGKS